MYENVGFLPNETFESSVRYVDEVRWLVLQIPTITMQDIPVSQTNIWKQNQCLDAQVGHTLAP